MNDTTIIKTISAIYFIIVSFLSFIFITLSLVFIILQNGIYVDDVSLENIKIKQLYIKWNEKLNVSVKDVQITQTKNDESKIDYKTISDAFSKATLFQNWFEKVTIEDVRFNDVNASFNYSENSDGFLRVSSQNFTLESSLYFESNALIANVEEFRDFKRKISVDGKITLSNDSNLLVSLNGAINDEIFLKLLAYTDRENLFYQITSQKEIKSLDWTVNSLGLPQAVKYWVLDAIDASYLKLDEAYGWIEYKDVQNAYKHAYVKASLKDLNYTYDVNLDAIHTERTELEFKDGALFIYPKEAHSYKQFLDKSWIKVDFAQKEEMVKVRLLFDGILNKDVLGILSNYKIELPFLQKKGKVSTDLEISVNLRTLAVRAKGEFFAQKANFDYLGLNVDLFDAYVRLDGYEVRINDMLAKYKNIASTYVDVEFDAKSSTGTIDFKIQNLTLNDIKLSLDSKDLKATYEVSPQGDFIRVNASKWRIYGESVEVEELSAPIGLDDLIVKIPKTGIKVKDVASLYVSGKSNLKTKKMDLNVDLLKLSYKGVQLAQSKATFKASYDKYFKVISKKKLLFTLEKTGFALRNASLAVKNGKLNLKTLLAIDDVAKTNVNLKYKLKTNDGSVFLRNTNIASKEMGSVFSNKDAMRFNFNFFEDALIVESKKIDAIFVSTNDKWFLNLGSLDKISKNSDVLKKIKITNGDFNLNKINDGSLNFNSSFKYPHKILVVNNLPLSDYDL